MVARIFRLRIALLGAVFRGPLPSLLRALGIGFISVLLAIAIAWVPVWLIADVVERSHIDVLIVSVLLLVSLLVPFFISDKLVEPRQFADYPETPQRIASGMLWSTLASWPFIWFIFALAAMAMLRPEWWDVAWVSVLSLLLCVLAGMLAARVSAGLARLVVPPQGKSTLQAVGIVLCVALLPVILFAIAQVVASPASSIAADTAAVLGFTPFGAPIAAIHDAMAGETGMALLRLTILCATIIVLVVSWYAVVRGSLRSVAQPARPIVGSRGLDTFERLPATPRGVIAARSLIYWARDPRYRIALIAVPIAPVVMLVALWVAGADMQTLALIPLPVMLLLLGWAMHNDLSMDSTALWLHLASGTRGADDRAGRLAPVLLIGVPLVLIGSSLTVTIIGDWRILPAVLGLNFGVLFASLGAASIWSSLMPYPATRPGDSPFAQPAGAGTGSGTAQTLSMLTAMLLSVPSLLIAWFAIAGMSFTLNIAALALGTLWGLLVLSAGVAIGGHLFDRNGTQLLALTESFD